MTDLDITNCALLNKQLTRLTHFIGTKIFQVTVADVLNNERVVLSIELQNKFADDSKEYASKPVGSSIYTPWRE